MDPVYKLPRLYVETLSADAAILTDPQWHYLKNVLRCKRGDGVRLFNETAGEYRATITEDGKKPALQVDAPLRVPCVPTRRVHLYVPPLPKDRFDFLIEKATELGMTDFHPLMTDRTTIRAVNEVRLRAQAIEAAEQCERMDIPVIHKPVTFSAAVARAAGKIWAAVERLDPPLRHSCESGADVTMEDISILIGPPGGWTDAERDLLLIKTTPLDLGVNILRAETAALTALVRVAPR